MAIGITMTRSARKAKIRSVSGVRSGSYGTGRVRTVCECRIRRRVAMTRCTRGLEGRRVLMTAHAVSVVVVIEDCLTGRIIPVISGLRMAGLADLV
jgi:hypothetical protein